MTAAAALLAHIEAMNAVTRAWVAEAPGRWATEFHTNMEDWAEAGIRTVEEFDAMLEAEHEREMRKQAMYAWMDDEDMTPADHNYWGWEEFCAHEQAKEEREREEAWAEYQLQCQLKKFGVETAEMLPTHFEVMANKAGYLEY